jgi:transcriptional regulator with XRE-family HTH domain
MNSEEFVPNERLRQARSLKSWSQAELAEQVGTSFEMVSRWERGITLPGPHYRKRLCTVLGQTAEELGLVRNLKNPFIPPTSPFVLLASSHADAEKAIVSHLKTALEERGITLLSSHQLGKQGNGNAQPILREVVHAAHAILVVISPQARASRHVREALEMASRYQRPVCGVWIEGELWQHCLPEGHVELAALIDARERDTPAMLEETARALEQVRLASLNGTEAAQSSIPDTPTEGVPFANLPTGMHLSTNSPEQPAEPVTPQSQVAEISPPPRHSLEPTIGAKPLLAVLPLPATPPIPGNRMGLSVIKVGLLVGLAILVIAGGILGSLSLLTHFGVFGTRSGPTTPARGGTWTQPLPGDIDSLIPNGSGQYGAVMDQALYLPLFYGDAGCDPSGSGDRGAHHPEWGRYCLCNQLDVPSAIAPDVVGWVSSRCT